MILDTVDADRGRLQADMKKTILILCFILVWSFSSSCGYLFEMFGPDQATIPTEARTSAFPSESVIAPSVTATETVTTITTSAVPSLPALEAVTTAREVYRVRRSSDDATSQIGAFFELENATRMADRSPGYHVFNSRGERVYSGPAAGTAAPTEVALPTVAPTTTTDAFLLLDNTDLSFWYRRGYGGAEPSIDAGYASLFTAYPSYWLRSDNPGAIYLTFDCGYEYHNNTNHILDILAEHGVKAIFFVSGSFIRNNPVTVARMKKEGHLVGNHTDQHIRPAIALARGLDVFQEDIRGAERAMIANTGYSFDPFFRPPEGGFSERSLAVANAAGYTNVFWSFAYRDWETDAQMEPAAALAIVSDQLHGGAILLLHAVSDTNVAILPDLISEIQRRGYALRRLDN